MNSNTLSSLTLKCSRIETIYTENLPQWFTLENPNGENQRTSDSFISSHRENKSGNYYSNLWTCTWPKNLRNSPVEICLILCTKTALHSTVFKGCTDCTIQIHAVQYNKLLMSCCLKIAFVLLGTLCPNFVWATLKCMP